MPLIDEVRQAQRLPSPAFARVIRVAAGVTQERLANEIGVHRQTIAGYEAGRRTPRGATRARYAELLEQLRAEVGS